MYRLVSVLRLQVLFMHCGLYDNVAVTSVMNAFLYANTNPQELVHSHATGATPEDTKDGTDSVITRKRK